MWSQWWLVYTGFNVVVYESGPSWPWSYGSWIYKFTTTSEISAYQPLMFRVRISIKARCTALCDKVCQWLATGRWFSTDTSISSTNKTYHHDITGNIVECDVKHHKATYHTITTTRAPEWLVISQRAGTFIHHTTSCTRVHFTV